MRFEGKIIAPAKGEKYWGVEIALLQVYTQGKNREDAYAMAADAVECLVDRKDFKVTVHPGKGNVFTLVASDTRPLISRFLQIARSRSGLTMKEVAERMGSRSKNAYAQYEQGKILPSFDKLTQILQAIDPRLDLVFRVRKLA